MRNSDRQARGPKLRVENRSKVFDLSAEDTAVAISNHRNDDDVILQKALLYHQRQLAMSKDTEPARYPPNRQDRRAKLLATHHQDCEDKDRGIS